MLAKIGNVNHRNEVLSITNDGQLLRILQDGLLKQREQLFFPEPIDYSSCQHIPLHLIVNTVKIQTHVLEFFQVVEVTFARGKIIHAQRLFICLVPSQQGADTYDGLFFLQLHVLYDSKKILELLSRRRIQIENDDVG